MKEDAGVGDQGETEVGGQSSGLVQALSDWRVWWMSLAMTAQVCNITSIGKSLWTCCNAGRLTEFQRLFPYFKVGENFWFVNQGKTKYSA